MNINEIENINDNELIINLTDIESTSELESKEIDKESIKPLFLRLSNKEQKSAIEALIFSSEEPISADNLFKILLLGNSGLFKFEEINNTESLEYIYKKEEIANSFNFSSANIIELIEELNKDLDHTGRAFQIVKVAGGYQFATKEQFGELIQQLIKTKNKKRLSQASMECLAIVAYKQPITKPEIESIRGVNSNEVVNSLFEKGLIEPIGRKDVLGKPLLYGTTLEFLRTFGLNSIEDLPKLKEFEELNNFGALEEQSKDMVLNFFDKQISPEDKPKLLLEDLDIEENL